MLSDAEVKDLKIKAGILKRTLKDIGYYVKEEATERQRLEKKRESGASENDMAQQQRVIDETLMMIRDSQKRLYDQVHMLQKLLGEYDGPGDAEIPEPVADVRRLLAEAEVWMKTQ